MRAWRLARSHSISSTDWMSPRPVYMNRWVPQALPDALAVEGVHAGKQVGDLYAKLAGLPDELLGGEAATEGAVGVQVAVGDPA